MVKRTLCSYKLSMFLSTQQTFQRKERSRLIYAPDLVAQSEVNQLAKGWVYCQNKKKWSDSNTLMPPRSFTLLSSVCTLGLKRGSPLEKS